MSDFLIKGETLTAIADKLREVNGTDVMYDPDDIPAAIPAGGGDIDGLIERSVTEVSSETAEKIAASVFSGYTILADVNLPTAISVGNSAFNGCSALKSAKLPSVESIGANAFYNCAALTDLQIPMATYIGKSGLYYCSAIANIALPSVKSIDASAFGYCKALESIELPATTSIGASAFNNCIALRKVDLGICESIGMNAFENCKALEVFIVRSTSLCILGSWAFPGTGYIYVPAALVDTYKADTNWSAYADQIRALEDYTVDGTITGALDEAKISATA